MNLFDEKNSLFKIAYDFVNDTQSNIYLTGKAGTGKTTFLKFVKANCTKNLVVVAPTGVAAINAGGVTMHSFFQLPFSPFIAEAKTGFGQNANVVDKHSLLKNIRFNSTKRKLIEELELLIIDEVSMLRADMLDAIDTILRTFRKNGNPFGGVQVLFIGDLFQLPPVVTDNDKAIFEQNYSSPFFFGAKIFEETKPIFIELKKIYRQNEESFIGLLNKVRHNHLEYEDFEKLNERYIPNFKDYNNEYITLTSHNNKADTINQRSLHELETELHEFKGEIKNDFSDKQLPTEFILKLKEGAQVMFIKNDSSVEKRYYNGKIATIYKIYKDEIVVQFLDTKETFTVEKETWDNVNYSLNTSTNEIEETVLGQFIQYPLRLAWAITIHKSQGLTFEKAIIDAGYSFAPGQVYVALSRCTTLSGLVLLSPITSQSLHNDWRIADFSKNEKSENELTALLVKDRFYFQIEKLNRLFNWQKIVDSVIAFKENTLSLKSLADLNETNEICKTLVENVNQQKQYTINFQNQLQRLLNDLINTKEDAQLLLRMEKAIEYFTKIIHDDLVVPLEKYYELIQTRTRIKAYLQQLEDTEQIWWHKINELQKCTYNGKLIASHLKPYIKKEKIISIQKPVRGNSAKETLIYYQGGKTIEEISKIRGLAVSTIEGHLCEYIFTGELSIEPFLNETQIERIKKTYEQASDATTSVIKEKLNNEFSYTQLRMALNHLLFKKEISLVGKLPALPKTKKELL